MSSGLIFTTRFENLRTNTRSKILHLSIHIIRWNIFVIMFLSLLSKSLNSVWKRIKVNTWICIQFIFSFWTSVSWWNNLSKRQDFTIIYGFCRTWTSSMTLLWIVNSKTKLNIQAILLTYIAIFLRIWSVLGPCIIMNNFKVHSKQLSCKNTLKVNYLDGIITIKI
jgi:hypothetical protein